MINVMVNGLPGNMATKVAEHVMKADDMELIPYSLTGPEVVDLLGMVEGSMVELIRPGDREEALPKLLDLTEPFISIDFTQPSAVNDNADFYCRHNLPFVMGTTGGDRDALAKRIQESDIPAVIAPNMAKQIVAFQAFMEDYTEKHAGEMKGYELAISESHQKGKKDTSGTAKAMIKYFNQLGIDFEKDKITMLRDPEEQKNHGVPEEYLSGHGWHTYEILAPENNTQVLDAFRKALWKFLCEDKAFQLYSSTKNSRFVMRRSLDETVLFHSKKEGSNLLTVSHNVNGRAVYAKGTLDAVRFLNQRLDEKGKVYSMIDVLKGE